MVIVFYDAEEDCLYVSSEREPMRKVNLDDDPLSSIPNDDILYVQRGCYVTKEQMGQWLDGSVELDTAEEPNRYTGLIDNDSPAGMSVDSTTTRYIRPVHNGSVLIEDICTPDYPDGVELSGKWNFVPIDKIGKDVLEESRNYKRLVEINKIEVVSHEYVMKHQHKTNASVSPHERALNRILIKDDRRGAAGKVAADGGMQQTGETYDYDSPIEIQIG